MVNFRLSGKSSELTLTLEHPIHLDSDAQYKLALTGFFCEYNFYNLFESCSITFEGGGKLGFSKGYWTLDLIQKHIQKSVDSILERNALDKDDKKNKVQVGLKTSTKGHRVFIKSPVKFHMDNIFRHLLGFEDSKIQEYFDYYSAKNRSNTRPFDLIEIHCDIVENCFVNHDNAWFKHGETSLLHSFFPIGDFGSKIATVPTPPHYVSLKHGLKKIQQINVNITDQNNNLLEMFDSNIHIYLELIRV